MKVMVPPSSAIGRWNRPQYAEGSVPSENDPAYEPYFEMANARKVPVIFELVARSLEFELAENGKDLDRDVDVVISPVSASDFPELYPALEDLRENHSVRYWDRVRPLIVPPISHQEEQQQQQQQQQQQMEIYGEIAAFSLSVAPYALPAVGVALAAWLTARLTRRIRVKLDGVLEIEAGSVRELERMMEMITTVLPAVLKRSEEIQTEFLSMPVDSRFTLETGTDITADERVPVAIGSSSRHVSDGNPAGEEIPRGD